MCVCRGSVVFLKSQKSRVFRRRKKNRGIIVLEMLARFKKHCRCIFSFMTSQHVRGGCYCVVRGESCVTIAFFGLKPLYFFILRSGIFSGHLAVIFRRYSLPVL